MAEKPSIKPAVTTRITGEKTPDEADWSCPSSYAQISANIEDFLPAMTGSITRKFFLMFWKSCLYLTNERLRAFAFFKHSIKNRSYSVPLSCGKRG
ncbi:hypothetical protein ACGGXQ_003205 [Salmonella enterica]|nr:hypothetical protein [Salmonella enterica]EJX4475851.1 hypothetical protein [Salmonella enterica]EKS4544284.1 hypothetical protein [Salmonella enterica]EKS4548365.1 hypothetical protein [Salmonella enterica]EKS4822201.1 hypothetical protein [Salmonella enterica]